MLRATLAMIPVMTVVMMTKRKIRIPLSVMHLRDNAIFPEILFRLFHRLSNPLIRILLYGKNSQHK